MSIVDELYKQYLKTKSEDEPTLSYEEFKDIYEQKKMRDTEGFYYD